MMERWRRLVLWCVMLLLALVFCMKGHGPSRKESPVAFFHDDARPVKVRICGNVANPGIYAFDPDANVETVINMTVPGCRLDRTDRKLRNSILHNGDVLELRPANKQHVDITIKKMQTREMVVLGIPLDPNRMGVDDWDYLPGIGPVLALRIVRDRQINGGFRSLKDLKRVPGIGEAKLRQIYTFF